MENNHNQPKFFPECVAKGSRFTLGVWGGDVLARRRFCDRNRRQSSATIDNEVAMAVPLASSAKVVTFGDFKRRVASFHVAGVVL